MEWIYKTLSDIKVKMKRQSEWQDAVEWAKVVHPSWVQLATQRNRPEIQETYRKKILRGYCERCW